MGYRAYPEYKQSGVEWLGKIPSHWDHCPVKRKFLIANGSTPKSGEAEFWDGDILWITPADFSRASFGYLNESGRTITDAGLASCGTRLVPSNSIVVSVRAPIGEVVQAASELCTNQGCKSLIRDTSETHERYFFHVLSCSSKQLNALGLGTTFLELSTNGLGQYRVPLPPHQEQEIIAQFLDHKTAQIDRLIEKKQELIEKLQEQIVTATTQAITKGLGNINLKPSGIAWLEQTPEHWAILPLKFLATIGNGSTPARDNADYWLEGETPWLNSSNVNKESVSSSDQFVTDTALRECHLPLIEPPAVLVGITGQGRTRGMATLLKIKATINQHLAYIKPVPEMLDVVFLLHVLTSAYQFLRSESDGGGSTKGAITCEQLANLKIPVPPIAEQKLIADLVASALKRSNASIERAEVAIERLQEYRAALITAAVTGQIDVRDFRKEQQWR